uniref:Nad4L n=1 Tax=Schizocladia ischiensis TaxID=196139 RepID=A0A7S6ZPE7_9STRA|nr:Nad4L [Schizocladia ischiensis]QOW07623.1 Nad4L [Schizocladia ischiensis]
MEFLQFCLLTTAMFFLGIGGIVLNRTNILILLMSIEVSLLALGLNFLILSVYLDDILGQVFCLFILTVAGCESSIGLAIILAYYRVRGRIRMNEASLMKA